MVPFIALTTAMLGAVTGGGGVWFWRRRARAQVRLTEGEADTATAGAAQALATAVVTLIEPYKALVTAQGDEIAQLRRELHVVRDHVHQLERVVRDAGLELPPWPPGGH